MNKPFTLLFDSPPLSESTERPDLTSMNFEKAKETMHVSFASSDVVSQVLNFFPFYMDLVEINTDEDFTCRYEIQEHCHFLLLMLKGSLRLTTEDGHYMSHIKEDHFGIFSTSAGVFRAEVNTGNHIGLCVSIDPGWLTFISSDLPSLHAYLHQPFSRYTSLPYCRLTGEIRDLVEEIRSRFSNGLGDFDVFFRSSFLTILKKYNSLALKKQKRLPYRVLQFIHEHYLDPELNSPGIAFHFKKAERSLRDQFKTEFSITMRDYYTSLRIQYAKQLMHRENLPIAEVYYRVGYNDESTFRYELKKWPPLTSDS